MSQNNPEAPPIGRDFVLLGRDGDRAISVLGLAAGSHIIRRPEQATLTVLADSFAGSQRTTVSPRHEIEGFGVAYASPPQRSLRPHVGSIVLGSTGGYALGMQHMMRGASTRIERESRFDTWLRRTAPSSSENQMLSSWINWDQDTVIGGYGYPDHESGEPVQRRMFLSARAGLVAVNGMFNDGTVLPAQAVSGDTPEMAQRLGGLFGEEGGVVIVQELHQSGEVQVSMHVTEAQQAAAQAIAA